MIFRLQPIIAPRRVARHVHITGELVAHAPAPRRENYFYALQTRIGTVEISPIEENIVHMC